MIRSDTGAPADIGVSSGTAAVLGLTDIRMDVAPTTAYLLLGGRCAMNCGFCAQARQSHASALNLSRVTWPAYPLDDVAGRIAQAYRRGDLRRACIQVTVGPGDFAQTLGAAQALRRASAIPVDVSILPQSLDEVRQLFEAGIDHIGFGLDAACRRVFEAVKGGSWERSLQMIHDTARLFPGRAAVHLIVGLGETEREMVEMMGDLRERGVVVGLFAFTPVRGTEMEHLPAPPLNQYRRMQAARFLMAEGVIGAGQCQFDADGRLIAIEAVGWRDHLADGSAFETSGCPDCNRPYYNERPGGTMYNYARPLTPDEAAQALRQTDLT